jgi:multidrug resistance efflux pump
MHAAEQQNMAERPSYSQLIHNPLFILAFAFARSSIVTMVALFKKKVMRAEKTFRASRNAEKNRARCSQKTSSPARDAARYAS